MNGRLLLAIDIHLSKLVSSFSCILELYLLNGGFMFLFHHVRRIILPMLLLAFCSVSAVIAATPGRPKEFTTTVSGNPAVVKLSWKANSEGPTAIGYHIYAAQGETEDLSKFEMIRETQDLSATISNKTGVWTFFVRAYNADGESDRTPIKVVNIQNESPRVKFVTTPSTTAKINKQYVYEAQAKYNDSRDGIRYRIDKGPYGMEIDPETGRITWTPTSPGRYVVLIRAYLISDSTIYALQDWTVSIDDNNQDFMFTTTPPKEGTVGKEWVYESKAIYFPDKTLEIIYSIVDGPRGVEINSQTGRIVWTPQEEGVYVVVIRARVDGHPELTVDQRFEVKIGKGAKKDDIIFKSQPKTMACVGKEYVYEPILINAQNIPVTAVYSLKESPDGMTINEQTGVIRWTPIKTGEYKATIVATIPGTSLTAKQEWEINVRDENCNERPILCATINGRILDKDGKPLKKIWMSAIRTDKGNGRFKGLINPDNGNFSIGVPEGVYAVIVGGDEIIPEWYQDAETIEKSTKIPVKCMDSAFIQISVQRREPPKIYAVSGIASTQNGNGIMSVVNFIVKESNGSLNKEKSMQFMARTDNSGKYSINLPDNFTYVAVATPLDNKYEPIFYDNTQNPQEAASIKLEANREINFTLPERPTFKNGFLGMLVNSDGNGIAGRAIAIRIIRNHEKIDSKFMSASVETDANGNFSIANLLPGKYVILGISNSRDWVPGFYRKDALATINWKEATQLEIGETMLDQMVIVKLRKMEGKIGGGRIHGHTNSGHGIIKGDNVQGALPLPGVLVVAYDDNGQIADYGFSDSDGSYLLSEVGTGAFNVVLSKPNYDQANFFATIDYTANSVYDGRDIDLTPTSPTGVIEDAATFNASIYPNPTNGLAMLRFIANSGIGSISIVNSLGVAIRSFEMSVTNGDNVCSIDASGLESGLYFVRVSTGTTIFTMPMSILR